MTGTASEALPDSGVVRPPRVSICICTRNRPEALARVLDSLRASSLPPDQIVVSDDSTDGRTRELIRRRYPDVCYQPGPRRGLGANRNAAVASAVGEVVLFLDDDCLLTHDFLRLAVGRLLSAGERERTIVNGHELKHGQPVYASEQGFLGFQDRPYRSSEPVRSVVINAALFPRSLFSHLQFDERLIYGYDEIDLTTRAVAAGYRIVNCAEAANLHFPSPINRDYYGTHASGSRIYVTFKRYFWTQRRPLKALAYLPLAACHLLLGMTGRHGVRGIRLAMDALSESLRSIVSHARGS